jgi:hypothetical protein
MSKIFNAGVVLISAPDGKTWIFLEQLLSRHFLTDKISAVGKFNWFRGSGKSAIFIVDGGNIFAGFNVPNSDCEISTTSHKSSGFPVGIHAPDGTLLRYKTR